MFVVRRKAGESVVVGGASAFGRVVRVTVTQVANGYVNLAFDANEDVSIETTEPWTRRDLITSYTGGLPRAVFVNSYRRLLRKLDDARMSGPQPTPRYLPALPPSESDPEAPGESHAPSASAASRCALPAILPPDLAYDEPTVDSSGIVSGTETDCC